MVLCKFMLYFLPNIALILLIPIAQVSWSPLPHGYGSSSPPTVTTSRTPVYQTGSPMASSLPSGR